MAEHGQRPRRASERLRLGQEGAGDGKGGDGFLRIARDTHQSGAVPKQRGFAHAERLQRAAVVLLRAVEGVARALVERAQRGEFPVGHRTEDDDAVLVGDEDRRFDRRPGFL